MTGYSLPRRFRHFLGRHHARRKYDYREQWKAFTSRLSVHEVPEISGRLAEDIMRATGASAAAVYLMESKHLGEPGGATYQLTASAGDTRFTRSFEPGAPLPSWLRRQVSPVFLPTELRASVAMPAPSDVVLVAVCWSTRLLGFIVLGPQKTGATYTAEDFEFLATVAEQAAASIMAARQVEVIAPGRAESNGCLTTEVIHDIKNSVSALSILTHNAASHIAEPDFQRDALTTLSSTVERMRRLLGKLFTTGAPTPTGPEPIDLQALIIEATTPLITRGGVQLVRRLRPVQTLYGNRDALLRVVENLTTNAAEAMDREGTVTVTLAEEQGYAVISVADTGCGISEEYRSRHLFSPFNSTKPAGWGVGLYQTKQAVESQAGEILVESVEGRGTTFTVKLPLCADIESPSLESVR